MISNYQEQISKLYDEIREKEKADQRKRKEQIASIVPEVLEIEKKIGKLSIELALTAMKNIENKEIQLNAIRNKLTNLRVEKSELLVSKGFPTDYLSIHYKCDKCKDTGFIGITKCQCYKKFLVQLYYKNSDLKDLLEKNNFDNFTFNYYSTQRSGNEPRSPRKNMEEILSKVTAYIKGFADTNENLLFMGNSGTGKTFLTNCIAKELIERGFLVIYRTSDDIIKNLKEIKFNNNSDMEDLLVNCDLLIIDDLGTEQISDFSKTELFNLLNKKLLTHKKMIISTNLSLEDILKTYSERISSRLLGDFSVSKFYGEDIRIMKNLSKLR
ncbi:MAG: ATP-binding protein [Clostridiaceae bacterium]